MFLKKLDRTRYGGLWVGLQNMYSRNTEQYPQDLVSAYSMAIQHKVEGKRKGRKQRIDEEGSDPKGISFLQLEDLVPGSDDKVYQNTECYNCHK